MNAERTGEYARREWKIYRREELLDANHPNFIATIAATGSGVRSISILHHCGLSLLRACSVLFLLLVGQTDTGAQWAAPGCIFEPIEFPERFCKESVA